MTFAQGLTHRLLRMALRRLTEAQLLSLRQEWARDNRLRRDEHERLHSRPARPRPRTRAEVIVPTPAGSKLKCAFGTDA